MNASSKVSSLAILPPLLVMLLLTLLVGLTGYHLTESWRRSAETTMHQAAQAVLLTNIRRTLEQIGEEWPEHPELARQHWKEAQYQAEALERVQNEKQRFLLLNSFMARESNISRIDMFLKRDFPNLNLIELGRELDLMGSRSAFITLVVTGCMLSLGGILTLLTAWDLMRLLRALIRSRDLNTHLQEEERRRIARELHDGVIQELVDLKRHYQPQKLDSIVNNLRRVCQNLKPQVLDDLGLSSALEALADELRQSGVEQVRLNLDPDGLALLPKHFELPLFRVIQELFTNIKKHAKASQVVVTLVYAPEESRFLQAHIQDNGQGFSVSARSGSGMGLAGIRERIEQLDGVLHIDSQPGQGSRFRFSIPVPPSRGAKKRHAAR